mmetsp:Transcript_19690/g.46143  ORF Transcript_19690/g.46143 Transcript_19690/m.46143 type:complete len:266 (-) Transcript_19690:382-1179(-)
MACFVLLVALLAGGGRAWETFDDTAWELSAEPPWAAHTGSISVPMTDGSVLLLGGQAGRHGGALFDCFNCTNDVWRFEPTTEQWSNLSADVPWDPRWGHSAIATPDGTVWVIFGCCKKGMPTVMLNDIWTFNPSKGAPWTLVKQRPPFEGVQATSVALLGDDLWVVGGWSQSRGTLSQVAVFSTKMLEAQDGRVRGTDGHLMCHLFTDGVAWPVQQFHGVWHGFPGRHGDHCTSGYASSNPACLARTDAKSTASHHCPPSSRWLH